MRGAHTQGIATHGSHSRSVVSSIGPSLERIVELLRRIHAMHRQLLRDSFGWGFILWLIGYLLGIVFFFVLPSSLIGWVILPI